MASRKNRPVLYEVVERSRRQRETWRRPPTTSEPAGEGPPPRVAIAGETRTPSRPRSVRFVRGKLHAELGWPGMTVAGVAGVLIVLVAFEAGGRYAVSHHPDSAPAAENAAAPEGGTESAAPAHETAAPQPRRAAEHPTRAAPTAAREEVAQPPPRAESENVRQPESAEIQPGYSYVVIQHFRSSQVQAARDAGSYLIANGVDCFVLSGSDLRLVATEPFLIEQDNAAARSAQERRAEQLRERVRALGKEYARDHGYAFEQCYVGVLKRK